MTKVLIVEDETNIREMVTERLEEEGFAVVSASTFAMGQRLFASEQPDLVILDWRLPDGQGIELLKQWRQSGATTPVVFLSARVELIDKVLGLELGANDYITKPFEMRELIARLRVQERWLAGQFQSGDASNSARLESHGVTLELGSHDVFYHGEQLSLTRKEFSMLHLFLSHPGQVFTRDELLDQVWGYDQYPETRTVDTHVMQLRQKLSNDLIETVRGVGYRWVKNNPNLTNN
ncbi:MAG: response regulator transcription factor [Deltaproteobacteria bacterium]|nr:MAG: response regulator transcription factor [Deltaproteobacteria bacterium]